MFSSQVALFDKLSRTYQKLLEGLHGVHSSEVRLLLSSLSSFLPEAKNQRVPIGLVHQCHQWRRQGFQAPHTSRAPTGKDIVYTDH